MDSANHELFALLTKLNIQKYKKRDASRCKISIQIKYWRFSFQIFYQMKKEKFLFQISNHKKQWILISNIQLTKGRPTRFPVSNNRSFFFQASKQIKKILFSHIQSHIKIQRFLYQISNQLKKRLSLLQTFIQIK